MKKNNIVNVLILTMSMSALIFGGLFFATSDGFTSNAANPTFLSVHDNTNGTKLPVYSGRSSGNARGNASGNIPININTPNLLDQKVVAVAQPSQNNSFGVEENVISLRKNDNVQINNAGGSYGLLAVQVLGSTRQTGGGYSSVGMPFLGSQDNAVSKQGGLLGDGDAGVGMLDYPWWDETGDGGEFLGIDTPIGDAFGILLILAMLYAVYMYMRKKKVNNLVA